jgi:hypothetical protein
VLVRFRDNKDKILGESDDYQPDQDLSPLNEMGEHIRKHGLPEIDHSPSLYWKNDEEGH